MDAELRKVERVDDALAHMVAMFRVELRALRGRTGAPDDEAGRMAVSYTHLVAGRPVHELLRSAGLECALYVFPQAHVEPDEVSVGRLYTSRCV